MPVNTLLSREPRCGPVKTQQSASRWSSSHRLASIYSENAVGEDPQMMKTDNLLFDPMEMVHGTSKGMFDTDMSHQRVQRDRMWAPIMYTAGGLILFLVVVSFLRKN